MGCCCSCSSGRKPTRETSRHDATRDPESKDPTDLPPPYDFKSEVDRNSGVIAITKEPVLWGPNMENITPRVGTRTTDQTLYCAAAGGHLADVKRLLESGVNPSDRTVCDWCPLHWAANNDITHGHKIVKLLVEHGADVNQVSDTGLTPLDMARRAGKSVNVKFLEEQGAKSGEEMRNCIRPC